MSKDADRFYAAMCEYAPDMFEFMLDVCENGMQDEESGRYVLSQAQMNCFSAVVYKVISRLNR